MSETRHPEVSVVLPTYDRPEFVRRAAESVLDQTFTDAELIVVDDCSPTPAEGVLDTLSSSDIAVRYIRHEENRGAPAARNTGIEAATGRFVAFIDDDDQWVPTKLERQYDRFQRGGPAVGVVYTGQRFTEEGSVVHTLRPTVRGDVTEDLLSGASLGTFSTLMVRASVIEQAGLTDERFPCWQDREWPIRLSQYTEFDVIEDPLVVRESSGHSQISDDITAKRDVAYPLMLETFGPLAEEYGCRDALVAATAREVALSALQRGQYADARRFALRTIRADPTRWDAYAFFVLSLGRTPTVRLAQRAKRMVAARLD
ncbi:glycosyltransferase family 2 protein [Halomarina litorea]|uniref:glycosyltransferase family 2 protein n=1 Tax=Halomarina litorea TaxID=2961595 RepID=UPI0020C26898|nr:glycosyltransferase family 2 protein [Halomarina sp. BCD28]